MDIEVTGKGVEITDAIRAYAQDKAVKLPKYFDRVTEISVLADRGDHHRFKIEMICKVERSDPFVASSVHEDLYACIDETVDKLERQLHDHKEKKRNRKHLRS